MNTAARRPTMRSFLSVAGLAARVRGILDTPPPALPPSFDEDPCGAPTVARIALDTIPDEDARPTEKMPAAALASALDRCEDEDEDGPRYSLRWATVKALVDA